MPGWLFFLFEKRVERIGVWTELTKMLTGSTLSQFVLTTAFLVTLDAESLQVSHYGGISLGQSLWIDRKREQHFLQEIRCARSFCSQATKIANWHAQILRNPHYVFLAALPQFIMHIMCVTISVDPSGNSIEHEFNRRIMLSFGFTVRHGALHREIENKSF